MTSFLHAYFTRLHCQPLGVPTVEALRTLHLAHNCAIPFENLDVLLPREIQLDETALEEKLLYARRGGYCFELNGLFERALRDIGFNVRSLLGRVILSHPASLPPRTHRLLLVDVEDEQWIADVGFGGQTLTAPLRLQAEIAQQTPHGEYRLMQEGSTWILQFRHHEHWQSMYCFDLGGAAAERSCDGQFLVGSLAAIPFSSSFVDVPPFA